ncbi:hypothetical protein FEM48_Zijuj01G0019300 [Ziziphus jujuba var. spinosa]|uniref:Calcium-transporting P-type ATPase N-terminal autoinhibitory domain-containing protein n=1 Tax=Ziziphus jujuba var. spinosa TaxID=714518 RepID=A0A978VYG6_ZIZJJ|nr:hypothetical protein FEM48_Zijuj01G0019300 [Ziziphus jujuba var. spinosa]
MSDMHRPTNLEAGSSRFGDLEDDESFSSPFDIPTTKSASIERLKRWRQAALVLNASRRFRYTLDLKKEEEKRQTLRKIREHARAIRAAYLFQAGDQMNGAAKPPPTPSGDFGIGQDQLASITRDHDFPQMKEHSRELVTSMALGIWTEAFAGHKGGMVGWWQNCFCSFFVTVVTGTIE